MKEIITGAIILERATELIKVKLPEKYKKYLDGLTISLILGIAFSLAYNLDFISQVGLSTDIPFLNEVLTGIFLTGGAGIFNSVIEAIESITSINKEEE